MRFTLAILSLLPLLAYADIPSSDSQCPDDLRLDCAPSDDGVRRCLEVDSAAICVYECDSQSACTPGCLYEGWSNGFCSDGQAPCLCSDQDAGFGS